MKLNIDKVAEQDYGKYKCVAKNALGETDGTVQLYSKSNNVYQLDFLTINILKSVAKIVKRT